MVDKGAPASYQLNWLLAGKRFLPAADIAKGYRWGGRVGVRFS